MREKGRPEWRHNVKICLAVIGIASLLFIPRLAAELALDELGSFWVVKDGIREALQRSVQVQGQSPLYYVLLWLTKNLLGVSPIALRALSLVCALLSLWLIFKLGELLFDRKTGIYSAFGLLCCSEFIRPATEARPYILAIALMLASSIALVRWVRSRSMTWLLVYAALLAGTIYAHYLFSAVGLIHALWILAAGYRSRGRDRVTLARQALLLALIVSIALAPAASQLHLLSSKGAGLSFAEFPSWTSLLREIVPSDVVLLLGLFIAFHLTIWRDSKPKLWPGDRPHSLLLVALWLMVPPIFVFTISFAAGHSVFLERYYSARIAGIAFIAGILIASLAVARKRVAFTACVAVVAAVAQFWQMNTERAEEGWKAAISKISELDAANRCSLLLFTGFVESQVVGWLSDRVVGDFIRAPMTYYDLQHPALLLPYTFDTAEAHEYYVSAVEPELQKSSCVLLLYRSGELFIANQRLTPSPIFLQEQMLKDGFHVSSFSRFGLVELVQYTERESMPAT